MKKKFLLMMLVSVCCLNLQGADKAEPAAKRICIVSPADDAAAAPVNTGSNEDPTWKAFLETYGLSAFAASTALPADPIPPAAAAAAAAPQGVYSLNDEAMDDEGFSQVMHKGKPYLYANEIPVYCMRKDGIMTVKITTICCRKTLVGTSKKGLPYVPRSIPSLIYRHKLNCKNVPAPTAAPAAPLALNSVDPEWMEFLKAQGLSSFAPAPATVAAVAQAAPAATAAADDDDGDDL